MDNDIYFQIGLIVLIGPAAKNAILIADSPMQGMEQGKTAAAAAHEAARLRFRPIIMTSLAFVFGVLPLVLAPAPAPRRVSRWAAACSAA